MADLTALAQACGKANPAGTRVELYTTCTCELNGMPQTRAQVKIAASQTPAVGDTKILDQPWDFSTAPSGQGYWRKNEILVDSGALRDIMEGEPGGQGFMSELPFQIVGTGAEQLEWADNMVAYSNCLIAMIRDKAGNMRVIGRTDQPAVVQSAEMNTGQKNGEFRGGTFVLKASTGYTAPIYDDATHAIDETPNP